MLQEHISSQATMEEGEKTKQIANLSRRNTAFHDVLMPIAKDAAGMKTEAVEDDGAAVMTPKVGHLSRGPAGHGACVVL